MKKSSSGTDAYARAGVNLTVGDEFSAFAGAICRESHGNSPFVKVQDMSHGHFRGPRGFQFQKLPKGCYTMGAPDGTGTKTIIIAASDQCHTAAHNMVAMTGGDITRYGGLPLVLYNVLEVKTLGASGSDLFAAYKDMMAELGRVAGQQKFVIMGGETAEMSACVSSEICGRGSESLPVFNWSATMIGVNHPDKLIDGSTVRTGQAIVAFKDGLRSNGASLCRKFLRGKYGQQWWKNPDARMDIRTMSSPAVLYDHFLAKMNGWYSRGFRTQIKVHAIAHLTGGGIVGKFACDLLFPLGFNAVLDGLYDPPQFMRECVESEGMSDEAAYSVFSGGQGLLAVVDKVRGQDFVTAADANGICADVVGYIGAKAAGNPKLHIKSKFSGETFTVQPQ